VKFLFETIRVSLKNKLYFVQSICRLRNDQAQHENVDEEDCFENELLDNLEGLLRKII